MDWLTFVATVAGSVAWPVTALIIVHLVRKPLVELLPTLKSAKYKELELEFGEKLGQLESQAEEANLPRASGKPDWVYGNPEDWTFGDYIERLAPMTTNFSKMSGDLMISIF